MGESPGIYSSGRFRCRLPATPQGEGTARGSPELACFRGAVSFPPRQGRASLPGEDPERGAGDGGHIPHFGFWKKNISLFPRDLNTQACVRSREKAEVFAGLCTLGAAAQGCGERAGGNALSHFPGHLREEPAVSPQASAVLLVFPMAAARAAGWLRSATAGLRGAGSSTPGPTPTSKPWESKNLGSGSGVISLEGGWREG